MFRPFLRLILLLAMIIPLSNLSSQAAEGRPIRILFLGHDSTHHNSNLYYPMLAQALGRDAIYFDYVTDVNEALDPNYLFQFDGLLLYANHDRLSDEQLKTLLDYVESGHGFIPLHCASACFTHQKGFIDLVGGQFLRHGGEVFTAKIIQPDHPALQNVKEFSAWDETYVHSSHNEKDRSVLMIREESKDNTKEPWTWVRTQGKGRVFYTASGHDQRTWSLPEFHQLVKSGILWAVGDEVASQHKAFLATRPPLTYETRGDIPNYENRPTPLPYQHPLSPADSMDYIQVPVGFQLKLFAAEPDIVNPISMAWDEKGRLWVAETFDYPNRLTDRGGNDRIKILEDQDGDGRCDKITIFADGLNIPTSLTLAHGGVIVAQAPDFLFLKDTTGDDRADVREVFFTGWNKNDTHAGPSNLLYGFDNWYYGTVGYAGFNGTLGSGEPQRFGMGVYRFTADASAIEFLHQFNNNTWGLGFNAAGDTFGSTANNNPSFFGGIPQRAFRKAGSGRSAKMIASSPAFHPITPNVRQVDAFGNYTAGCGHAFASSDSFPPKYRDQIAFVNGPTGHLLGTYKIERDGAGYFAKNNFAFLASVDEWVSPVAAEVGPDGALWVADWYNFIIQHNPTPSPQRGGYQAVTGPGNAHENPNRDQYHGRIYRVIWNDAPAQTLASLEGASPKQLVAALESGNQFWRLTAQRLLVQNSVKSAIPLLKQSLRQGKNSPVHALWSLHGLGALDRDSLQYALLQKDPALRRNAIRALDPVEASMELFFDSAVVTDPDLLVRLEAFNKLSDFPASEIIRDAILRLMEQAENRRDEWLSASLKAASAWHGAEISLVAGENILDNSSFETLVDGQPLPWRVRNYSGTASHKLSTQVAHTGSNALEISSESGSDTSWFTNLRVEPNTDYQVTAWIKTENVQGAMGALLNIHGSAQGQNSPPPIKGTQDWKEVRFTFNSGNQRQVSLNCLFGGWGHSTGKAWYDDITVAPLIFEATTASKEVTGNAERGESIFRQHPIAGCLRCHRVGNEGGVVGPPLDGIAARKTRDYLYQSLTEPNAQMAEGFQLPVSPMPPMGVLLSPQELADLMEYLLSLK